MSRRRANHLERMAKGTVVTILFGLVLLMVLAVIAEMFNDGEVNALIIKRTIVTFVGIIVFVYGVGYAVTDMLDDLREVLDR